MPGSQIANSMWKSYSFPPIGGGALGKGVEFWWHKFVKLNILVLRVYSRLLEGQIKM